MSKLFQIILLVLVFVSLPYTSSQGILGVSPGNYRYDGVLRGGYSERPFTVSFSGEDVAVSVEAMGEISSWINLSSNKSIVSKDSPFRFIASIEPPSDTPNGNYTGYLRVKTSQISKGGSPGRATGTILAVLDVALTVEVTDIEFISCKASNFIANSAEKGDNLQFKADFSNEGNIRLKPKFVVDLWDQDQISIVKTQEFIGGEILPTRKGKLNFEMPTTDLDIGQYWVDIHSLDCLDNQLLTLDVLQPGALKVQGNFKEIISPPVVFVKETSQIFVVFENIGEKQVDAQFKGQITLGTKIIQILESEKISVDVGEISNFSFFFTPEKNGNYIIDGRFFYDNKRTFELSKSLEAISKGLSLKSVLVFMLYLVIVLVLGYLYYKIRKEVKKYRRLG